MGISSAIAGGIMLFTIIYVMMMFPSMMDSNIATTNAARDMSNHEDLILQTDTDISSLSVITASNLVNFTLSNNGTKKLWDFENFDVVMTYDGSTSGRLSEKLNHAGDCSGNPSSGNWCVDSISSDILDPGILNEGESMIAKGSVNEPLTADGIVIVIISTENGVIATNSDTAGS